MRRIATLLTASLLTAGFFGTAPAQASTTEAARCDTMLVDLAEKQSVLEELQAAIVRGQAERDALAEEAATLAVEIAQATAAGRSAKKLQHERASILEEIAGLGELATVVRAQAEALAADVDQTERAYIGCIDASISL